MPVVSAARALGWRVTVVDHRPAYGGDSRFAGAHVVLGDADALLTVVDVRRCHAAVVMSHHLASDAAYLRELAAAGVPGYVGLLGPAARRRRLMQELGGAADSLQGRLHSPVGLDLGAVTPEAIALAIVSEIHAWLARAERGSNLLRVSAHINARLRQLLSSSEVPRREISRHPLPWSLQCSAAVPDPPAAVGGCEGSPATHRSLHG